MRSPSWHTLLLPVCPFEPLICVGLVFCPVHTLSFPAFKPPIGLPSHCTQDTIEGKLEKRTKGVFAPMGGKKLVAFIDDLNMPQKSTFGFLPPLELLKLWVDNGFW